MMKRLLVIFILIAGLATLAGCDIYVGDGASRVEEIADARIDEDGILHLILTSDEEIEVGAVQGESGRDIELSTDETHILWRYEGEPEWRELKALETLEGADGKDVELRREAGNIEWRQDSEGWEKLISKEALRGDDGREVELRGVEERIEWRYEDTEWETLMSLSELEIELERSVEDIDIVDDELLLHFSDGDQETLSLPYAPHTIRFTDHEGRLFDMAFAEDGQSLDKPEPPSVEGMTFIEWSDSTENIEGDREIQAQYEPNTYTISFETYTAESIDPVDVEFDELLDLPIPTSEDEEQFLAWYTDDTFTNLFARDRMPAEDLTLHARWLDSPEGDVAAGDDTAMLAEAKEAVVFIEVETGNGTSSGSGAIIDRDGDTYSLFTNEHVVEGADSLSIIYQINGNPYTMDDGDITLEGVDAETDLALLTFETDHDIEPLDFRDSHTVEVGELAYAIGSPLGYNYFGTITRGIISRTDHTHNFDGREVPIVQHDASINPGNSGGPLIDSDGDILGVNTYYLTFERNEEDWRAEGMFFSVPASTTKRVLEDLAAYGEVIHGEAGFDYGHVATSNTGLLSGVHVESVEANTTADRLGLESGDVITGFKREGLAGFIDVDNEAALFSLLFDTREGSEVRFRYVRDEETFETDAESLDAE